MFTAASAPLILSPFAVSFAATFRPGPAAADEAARLHIPLPPSLSRAADKRVAEFVAGRYCAGKALDRLGRPSGAAIGVRADRGPDWPPGVVGSITHTAGFAWAAVAPGSVRRGLGIDSETMPRGEAAREIAPIVLATGEAELLGERFGPRQEEGFVVVFALSAKESFYKCLAPVVGPGLEFRDATFIAVDATAGTFVLRLERSPAGVVPAGLLFPGRFAVDERRVYTAVEW